MNKKTIWITGASSGIGEALAKQLSAEGFNLILSARRAEELERVREICDHKDNIAILPIDLSKPAQLEQQTKKAVQCFGSIDILINNAGRSQRSFVKDTLLKVDRDLMEVNYFGAIALTKYLLPHMMERGSGHFVVVTSLTGIFGTPYRSGYAASKHALHGFYDSMRAELEGEGIKVTIAAPGFIRTTLPFTALTGDGSPLGTTENTGVRGISPETCAAKIIKAMKRQKREVYIGKESYAAYVKRFSPGVFARLIKKVNVK